MSGLETIWNTGFSNTSTVLKGFNEKHNINKLVYFEHTTDGAAALEREKEIKKWRREKKNNLVRDQNPAWKDLSEEWGKDFSLWSK